MTLTPEIASTVRVSRPPNPHFQPNEEFYVKAVRGASLVIHKFGTDLSISQLYCEVVEKDWKIITCPHCQAILAEVDKNTFYPHSIRVKCRMCKEYSIVRGGRILKYTEKQVQAVAEQLKVKIENGEYSGPEAAIALIAMEKSGRLSEQDVELIIKHAYKGNELEGIAALERARFIINENLTSEIAAEVASSPD